jgi:hypothetical protein
MIGACCVLCRVSTRGRRPSSTRKPSPARCRINAWYSAVTPSSLKRLAMVPKTGISSADLPNSWRLRCTCFETSRSASAGVIT